MPRRKFNKQNATTFSLVYRAQNDPRIHDPDASDMVFAEKINPNREKFKRRQELENEFGDLVRGNEGEAAEYGVYYDDTEYDYMQHLRDIGSASEAHFIEAPVIVTKGKEKGKEKIRLEDALRDLDIRSVAETRSVASSRVSSIAEELLPEEMLPSEYVQPRSYQDQQDVPDEIAGFQPDMDPRLREVLEALDDDAYVDDDEEIFQKLAQEGEEVGRADWETSLWHDDGATDDDDGWESDCTITKENLTGKAETSSEAKLDTEAAGAADATVDQGWMHEFNKFKNNTTSKTKPIPENIPQDLESSVQTGASSITGLRRKKRKGALTVNSGYSMSSSILSRTEGQSILDQKFEKLQEVYEDDELDDDASMVSGLSALSGLSKLSSASKEPTVTRTDFDTIMDDFLGGYSEIGRRSRRVKRTKPQTGLEQLREIREGLGPALIRKEKA
jgi:protein LTV1